MKKLSRLILATLIVFCSLNLSSTASSKVEKAPHETLTPQQQVRLHVITERLAEIKHMDKSTLTKSEKKSLKSELRQLKKEARGMAVGGVFLTVASLLAVIVLLILLL